MKGTMDHRLAPRPGEACTKGKRNKTTLYRAQQMNFMLWQGANTADPGWLRGVKLNPRTWTANPTGPVITAHWAVLYGMEIMVHGYNYLSGRKKTPKDDDPLWWKSFYLKHYGKTLPDDTARTYGPVPKKRHASGAAKVDARRQPQPLTWLGTFDKVLHALEDLKTQQQNTDPAWYRSMYVTAESRQLLRPSTKAGKKDSRFNAIKTLMLDRQKNADASKERDKFSDTLVDSLTFTKHLEMLQWYMQRGTYAGALQAMNAAAKFVAALRPSDTRALVLSDMGVDLTGQIVKMPWRKDKNPVLGFLYLGKNPDTNKSEMSFYLPHMNDEANLFFYKGHYFFWRWTILKGTQPDFSPFDEGEVTSSTGGAASQSSVTSAGGVGAASSTCKCAPTPHPRPQYSTYFLHSNSYFFIIILHVCVV
jgi:hypothetical protein